jgi:predicted nuclease with TOPRIM domain
MAEEFKQKEDVVESDIVFECPSCSKSLAMDRRGAGLTIDCPGCGELVRVPTPSDLVPESYKDLTEYADIEELQEALIASQEKVSALTSSIGDLARKSSELEVQRTKNSDTIASLRNEFSNIQQALDNIYKFLQD